MSRIYSSLFMVGEREIHFKELVCLLLLMITYNS